MPRSGMMQELDVSEVGGPPEVVVLATGDLAARTLASAIPAPVERPSTVRVEPASRRGPWPLGPVTGGSRRGRLIRVLERALTRCGVAHGFAAVTKACGAVILNYHAVADGHEVDTLEPTFTVSAEDFEHQVEFLAEHRNVVPLSELVENLRCGRTMPRGTVCLTFDDAYRNTLTTAAPILTSRKVPATLFVPTGLVDRGENPWLDTICHAIRHRTCDSLTLSEIGLTGLRFTGEAGDTALFRRLNRALLPLDLTTRNRVLQSLLEQLHPRRPLPRLVMTWSDLRRLRELHPTIEIGAHGVDHVDLTELDADAARRQIIGSLDAIEHRLGMRPALFSCPYDRTSPQIATLLAEAGCRAAVSAGSQPLLKSGADPMRLARLTATSSLTLTRFYTSGAHPALPRLLFGRSQ